jgi:translocation protein SEC62
MYAGSLLWSNIATGAVIAIVIGFTLLPVWPDAAKKVLWYFTCTFLIFMVIFILIRFIAFLILWILGYEFWVFPRLFDESLSFQDSFKPVYTFEKGSPGQGYYRMALVGGLIAFVYWALTQPTEFDGFLTSQKEFIKDIYSGNLLADVAQVHKDTLDRTKSRIPDLEALLRDMAADEIEMAKETSNGTETSESLNSQDSLSNEEDEASAAAAEKVSDDLLEGLLRDEI